MNVTDPVGVIEKAINAWSIIDLPGLQKELDERAIEIQENASKSLASRKELATETKAFKKLSDEEKLENFSKLLKSYQNEIDVMNKKSKNFENLIFKIYRAIGDISDPKPLLKSSLDSLSSLHEMDKVKEENAKLEEKLSKFADYEQLKEKIKETETQLTSLHSKELKAKEDEWKNLLEEKEANWAKNENEKNLQIEKLSKQMKEFEVNEKMLKMKLNKKMKVLDDEESEENEETLASSTSASTTDDVLVNNLKTNLESAQSRIKSLEKRNEELRREVSVSKSSTNIEVEKTKQENKNQISDLERENSLLLARCELERSNNKKLSGEIAKINEKLERETKQLNEEIETLKEFKQNSSDYEEIKKELEILKQIQFGDGASEIDGEATEADGGSKNTGASKIESAIVQRNKKLNNDLVELRNANEKLNKQMTVLNEKVKQYETEVSALKDSNLRLEEDLLNFESSGASNDKWETMSMISSVGGGGANRNGSINGKVSPATSIAGGFDNSEMNSAPNADSSLLPIITQQRDRFRNRNKELEEDNKKQFSKVIELKREINTLKTDNRELYEKIRFLEHHQTSKNSFNVDIENKYLSEYENDLHPIEQFRIMETKRINSKISPWDRIFIQVTKTVLSSQYTRWLFVSYCFGLHFLVFILTISLTGSSTPEYDQLAAARGSLGSNKNAY